MNDKGKINYKKATFLTKSLLDNENVKNSNYAANLVTDICSAVHKGPWRGQIKTNTIDIIASINLFL